MVVGHCGIGGIARLVILRVEGFGLFDAGVLVVVVQVGVARHGRIKRKKDRFGDKKCRRRQ